MNRSDYLKESRNALIELDRMIQTVFALRDNPKGTLNGRNRGTEWSLSPEEAELIGAEDQGWLDSRDALTALYGFIKNRLIPELERCERNNQPAEVPQTVVS